MLTGYEFLGSEVVLIFRNLFRNSQFHELYGVIICKILVKVRIKFLKGNIYDFIILEHI